MFDFLAGEGLHIDVLLHGSQTDETLGKELAGAQLEVLRVEIGHDIENARAFTHMGAFISTDVVADVAQEFVVPICGGVD